MPYKDRQKRLEYARKYGKERYQRMRRELIQKLGGRCSVPACEATENLEVHHIEPYRKRSRPNSSSYFDPLGKELRCQEHHSHTESWRRKRKRKVA